MYIHVHELICKFMLKKLKLKNRKNKMPRILTAYMSNESS